MPDRTHPRLHASGKALVLALPIIGIGSLSTLVMRPQASEPRTEDPPKLEDIAPRSMIVGAEFAFLNITPETLAGAGIESAQVTQLMRAACLDSDFGIDRFRAARMQHQEAQATFDETARRIRAGRAEAGDAAQAESRSDYADLCLSTCQDAAGDLIELINGFLTPEQQTALATIRTNVKQGVPLPYAAVPLNEADRVRLRDALTARSFADRTGTEVPEPHASLLSTLDAMPAVTDAAFGVNGTAFIKNAYMMALSEQDN